MRAFFWHTNPSFLDHLYIHMCFLFYLLIFDSSNEMDIFEQKKFSQNLLRKRKMIHIDFFLFQQLNNWAQKIQSYLHKCTQL